MSMFVDTFVDTFVDRSKGDHEVMPKLEIRRNKSGEITGYRVRICVGRDANGKQVWRTTVIPSPGLTPARDRKEAERLAEEWEREQREQYQQTHEKRSRDKMTFGTFVNEYWLPLDVRDGKHAPNTVRFYEDRAREIVAFFGKKPLNSIGVSDCKRFIAHLRKDVKGKNGEPLSATTIEHEYRVFNNVMESARRMKFIRENPCDDLRPSDRPHKEADKKIDFLEPEEAQRFLECLSKEGVFWRAYFTVLLLTGLRRSEALGLQWQDLNTEEMTISVERNVTRDETSEDKIAVRKPKNGRSRIVPMTETVYDLLLQRKREQREQVGSVLPNAYIFGRADNPYRPIYPTSPTRKMARFIEKNGLKHVSPHCLRHSFATIGLLSGADLRVISETLGHASVEVTARHYAAVVDQLKRDAAEGVEKILSKKKA